MENVFCYNSNNGSVIISQGIQTELVLQNIVEWQLVDDFIEQNNNAFINVMLSYELKNSIEKLSSKNVDELEFPTLALVVPKSVCKIENNTVRWIFGKENKSLVRWWNTQNTSNTVANKLEPNLTASTYLEKIKSAQHHIQLGDIYELNFCQQHIAKGFDIDNGFALYQKLNRNTKAPFSVYFNWKNWLMLGASPERFLKKTNNKLVSQPIKGTCARGSGIEDDLLKKNLQNDPKERAENIMIVDLVRNDLGKIAQPGSVKVDELCAIYSFKTVHQMISTISCDLKPKTSFSNIIKATFPMGSMTGAPKVRAMQIIDELEDFQRGLYSGSVGYILPNGDFDLNVVIRSIIVNKTKSIVSCAVGGAITILSQPEKELEECHIKINKILSSISKNEH